MFIEKIPRRVDGDGEEERKTLSEAQERNLSEVSRGVRASVASPSESPRWVRRSAGNPLYSCCHHSSHTEIAPEHLRRLIVPKSYHDSEECVGFRRMVHGLTFFFQIRRGSGWRSFLTQKEDNNKP